MNPLSTFSRSRLALLCGSLLTLMAGCGGGLDPILGSPGVGIAPTVTATSPAARTPVVTGVATNSRVTATFSSRWLRRRLCRASPWRAPQGHCGGDSRLRRTFANGHPDAERAASRKHALRRHHHHRRKGQQRLPVRSSARAGTARHGRPPYADSLFNFDKSVIRPEGKEALDKFARELSGTQFDVIAVEGFTDRIGSLAYNDKLSSRRAEAVKAYLVASGGIDATKITAVGKGESNPVTKPTSARATRPARS